MLCLKRKIGETIVVGGNVFISIYSIDSGGVKLAISAPLNVPVDRLEVHLAKESDPVRNVVDEARKIWQRY